MHYSATKESNAVLKPEGFLLVDSGGHYLEGTTDITRTFALGALTDEEKQHFTAVCRSNMNLARCLMHTRERENRWQKNCGSRYR